MDKRKEIMSREKSLFAKTARELGCDESEEAFDQKLGKLSKAKPTPMRKSKKEKK